MARYGPLLETLKFKEERINPWIRSLSHVLKSNCKGRKPRPHFTPTSYIFLYVVKIIAKSQDYKEGSVRGAINVFNYLPSSLINEQTRDAVHYSTYVPVLLLIPSNKIVLLPGTYCCVMIFFLLLASFYLGR